jgi:integrase
MIRQYHPTMGRPPNPVGTSGQVRTHQTRAGTWKATCYVRDPDGQTRQLGRNGTTEAAARRSLAVAVRDRTYRGGKELTPDSRVNQAADRWLTKVKTGDLAPRTIEQYERVLRLHVRPGVGQLRIRELTVAACSAFLETVERRLGSATARTCRSVLSGIAGWCARTNLLDRNPVRDTGRISTKPRHPPRALDLDQARDFLIWIDYDDLAISRDIPDFLRCMLATGLRISEAAAIRPADVDLDAGTVAVTGNIIRVTGQGLFRQERESSKLNPRGLTLPSWAVDLFRDRIKGRRLTLFEPLFPAPLGGWRDPSNTQADIRDLRTFTGYPWVTSHTMRKTVASLMNDAGLSARAGADQLGHSNPSMTQDRYWGRGVLDTGAAVVLEQLGDTPITGRLPDSSQ